MKKRFLTSVLALATCVFGAFGFAACDDDENSSSNVESSVSVESSLSAESSTSVDSSITSVESSAIVGSSIASEESSASVDDSTESSDSLTSVEDSTSDEENSSAVDSESSSESSSAVVVDAISFNTLSVDGTTVYGKVSNSTTEFSFVDEVSVSGAAKFVVALDEYGMQTIAMKTIPLTIGDNKVYVFEMIDDEVATVYEVTVRRRPTYEVSFETNGGTAVASQMVEEDSLVVSPETTKLGYVAVWDYDFSTPIVADTHITASWDIIHYPITYDLEGGSLGNNPEFYTIEMLPLSFNMPIKVNYGFLGWYNGAEKVEGIEEGTLAPVHVTAKWGDYALIISGNVLTGIIDSAKTTCIAVEIPDNVTVIGQDAFRECTSLMSVVIPDSVTMISGYAFRGCTGLASVVIPDSVTEIRESAFYECTSLREITLPFVGRSKEAVIPQSVFGYIFGYVPAGDGVSVEGAVLQYQEYSNGYTTSHYYYIPDSLREVTITGGLIGQYAFSGCSRLTSIVIPDSATAIGDYAFSRCSRLTSIVIPDSVTAIGDYAFSNCSSLTSVIAPDSVTEIGESAFEYCNNLTSVYIANIVGWCNISFGNSDANPLSYAGNMYLNNELITELVIPDSVTSIGAYAFYGCTSLMRVEIPVGVTSIGQDAFGCCPCLTIYCEAASNLEGWSDWTGPCPVVWDCKNNEIANNGYTYAIIGGVRYALEGSKAMVAEQPRNTTTANFPAIVTYNGKEYSVATIGVCAFDTCGNLTSIEIPDSVTSISNYAFRDCTSLTSIKIPDSVTTIGTSVFKGCTSLTIYCEVSSQLDRWHNSWNNSCPVVWDCNNNDIDKEGCSYTVIDGVRYALKNSKAEVAKQALNLTTANIPAVVTYKGMEYNVKTIAEGAFKYCNNLTSVVIPDSVTSIGDYAFQYCDSLTSIVIPDSVRSIGKGMVSGCSNLREITLPFVGGSRTGNTYFGYIFGASSYASNTSPVSLKSVTITGGKIDSHAFQHCRNLENILLSDSVTSIGEKSFYNCSKLTNIAIPNGVKSIGSFAFYSCRSLTSVVIPSSVTSMGDYAFQDCYSLTSVYITDIEAWCNISFGNKEANPLSYAVNLYLNNERMTELVIPDTVTGINPYAFYLGGLTSIKIPDSVMEIGEYAFYGCAGLTSIEVPNTVTSIGKGAFSGCSGLVEITIPFVGGGNGADGHEKLFGYIFGYSSSTVEGWHSSDYDYREYISGNTYTYYYYHVPESLTKVTVTGRSIGAFAFKNCTSLTSIVIGYSVISIEREAFTGCTSLAAVYYMGTAEELSTLVNSSNNEIFMSTTKYYYIENEADVPTDGGNYWHYDENGNIAIW